MKNEKIIATIKKVLELSKNNPSEEEAKAAALKAQELLAKYNIKESDIDEETSENIVEKFTDVGLAKWKYTLASVIARNFRCQMFMCGRRIYFYGYETDTEVACSTFEYLYKVGDKKANAYTRKVKKEVGSALEKSLLNLNPYVYDPSYGDWKSNHHKPVVVLQVMCAGGKDGDMFIAEVIDKEVFDKLGGTENYDE